jgi:hypothetical protein|tara:strand:+ start:311 stop:517 length:207 start_codon:yes stop_codon:yes gene_type:complete
MSIKNFQEYLHTFMHEKKEARVYKAERGFGCRFFEDNVWVKDEVYTEHSEQYAEDAAENYVLGIKDVR